MPVNATFPESLSTARLELRAYGKADAAAILALIEADRQRLLRNFKDLAQGLATLEEARSFIADCARQREARKTFFYGIWLKEPRQLVGQLKLKNLLWDMPSAELSYFIGSAHQRQGYASEAIKAVLQEAFENLGFNRVYARIIASNTESLELARKLGMRHEGLHRLEFRCGLGELHDVNYFALAPGDFGSQR